MPLIFDFEPLASLLDDGVADLVDQHWHEIALDQADVPLAVDWAELQRQEDIGQFRVFSARLDGALIGYVSCYMFKPARYSTTLYVNDDVFWLHPDHRKGLTGYRMLAAFLKAIPRPCKVQIKEKLTFKDGRVGKMLERLGLKAAEVVYVGFLRE